jgi:hypothetical protein
MLLLGLSQFSFTFLQSSALLFITSLQNRYFCLPFFPLLSYCRLQLLCLGHKFLVFVLAIFLFKNQFPIQPCSFFVVACPVRLTIAQPQHLVNSTRISYGYNRQFNHDAGREKKKKSSSAPQQPPGPSTQSRSAGNLKNYVYFVLVDTILFSRFYFNLKLPIIARHCTSFARYWHGTCTSLHITARHCTSLHVTCTTHARSCTAEQSVSSRFVSHNYCLKFPVCSSIHTSGVTCYWGYSSCFIAVFAVALFKLTPPYLPFSYMILLSLPVLNTICQ